MIIKWIDVLPIKGKAAAFSNAQVAWEATAGSEGFKGQLGGWHDSKKENSDKDSQSQHAMILAFWDDFNAINAFMAGKHDEIVDNNNQAQTYQSCHVHYLQLELQFEPQFESKPELALNTIPSTVKYLGGLKGLIPSDIGFIRIADCTLFSDETGITEQTFFNDQTRVWNPAMQACEGMLGGVVARFIKQHNRFLVISFWQNEACHRQYMAGAFQTAKSRVSLELYIEQLAGYQIVIESKWYIEAGA
ncbi:DUF4937 domain-containing protein [Shewanella surugensis]|uniref:YdbC family protein n=1 Tax=Shewanella surugensis TaxID=212020 RepID=A0ABT0LAY8_9GAMM|nr:DUF4937 domain-containing protein [Shewanella surugensis]MCL1124734.1 YdbC family protein [Shewanella surugensis]